MNSITTSDCGVRWQRPLCRPRCLAPGRGHGVGDEPLTGTIGARPAAVLWAAPKHASASCKYQG